MRWLSGLVGGALLVLTVGSILRNLVVPRGLESVLVRVLWRGFRWVLDLIARPFRSYLVRDKVLAWLAPLVLIATLLWWLFTLFLAYGLLLHAFSTLSLSSALREAGSSLFTLGFASTARGQLTAIDFLAAVTGPLVVALQIAYLPTLYAAYNRRETEVTLLLSRAGEPARPEPGRTGWKHREPSRDRPREHGSGDLSVSARHRRAASPRISSRISGRISAAFIVAHGSFRPLTVL